MSAKHTPGPWALHAETARVIPAAHVGRPVGGAEDGERDLAVYAQEICALQWPDRHRPQDEVKANGRLIAAAPCLLHALQNIENDAGQMPAHAWKVIQDAIAKATGVAS